MHNWRRYAASNGYEIDKKNAVLNLALCCGANGRHREKPQYRCTTIYSSSCIELLQKDLGKFTFCRTFGAYKPVHSEPFLDYLYEV